MPAWWIGRGQGLRDAGGHQSLRSYQRAPQGHRSLAVSRKGTELRPPIRPSAPSSFPQSDVLRPEHTLTPRPGPEQRQSRSGTQHFQTLLLGHLSNQQEPPPPGSPSRCPAASTLRAAFAMRW